MKLKKIEFHQGQAVAVNTYISIIANACEVVTSHLSEPWEHDNIFYDFETLAQDKTMDKVDLANEMIKEITMDNGAYLRGDFKDLGLSTDKYIWFESVHNLAIKTALRIMNFNNVDLTIIK